MVEKTRILVLTNGKLPVPAVKGGAIESLLDSLIEENEKHQKVEMLVISTNDPTIKEFNRSHQSTQVIPVETKERKIQWFIQKCWYKGRKLLTGKHSNLIAYPEIIRKAKSVLQENQVDCVIDLNCPERIPMIRSFFSGKLAVYLHNDYLNPQTVKGQEILKQLDGVVSVCSFLNEQVKKIPYSNKFPSFYRVNNGIELSNYQPAELEEKRQIRSQLHLKESDCVIVFSGRITETKGVHLLLEALGKMNDVKDVKVLICGGITYSSAKKDVYLRGLMKQAEKLPVEVIFTGYIEKKEIPFYLKAADICAVPSIFHETCCLTAVEAQAMGIPVIATKIGGIPEYISEKSAMLINYDQDYLDHFTKGLDRMIHDRSFREQLRKEALKNREEHSQERYYKEFIDSIEHLVGLATLD
ncbi:hypothetical protein A5860_001311 [Enterococcus faecium]|nr:hypothetical protein A5836_002522 [Enterococcus faecium]OTP06627.1 hypothetical protein A5860_001311 [Enterococcus faecium]